MPDPNDKDETRPKRPDAGFGAWPSDVDEAKAVGFGRAAGEDAYERACDVYELLSWGTPQLAYAVAKGFTLAPLKIPIAGTFPDDLTVSIPQAANKEKIVQDLVVDRISWHLENLNTPTGVFDAQSNYFFAKQSGIEAQFNIVGAPRYPIASEFTPVTELEGPTPGWILELTEGCTVSYRATFPLPDLPMRGTLTLHARTARWEKLFRMRDDEYLEKLREMGYDVEQYFDKFSVRMR